MRSSLYALSAAAIVASAPAMAREDYAVTGSDLVLGLDGKELFDIDGLYGQAGRTLRIKDSGLTLNASDPGRYIVGDREESDTYDGFSLSLNVNTQLSYTLVDADSGQWVSRETHPLSLYIRGSHLTHPGQEYHGDFFQGGLSSSSAGIFQGFENVRYSFYVNGDALVPSELTLADDSFVTYAFRLKPGLGTNTPFIDISGGVQIAPIPEPETYALVAAGLIGIGLARRRKAEKK